MGRGDRKTKKGKIAIRSYGNVRPHATKGAADAKRPVTPKAVAKPAVKKAAVKKTGAKKSA